VALNPRLQSAWVHLFEMSMGQDSAESGRALRALAGLGSLDAFPGGSGRDPSLAARLLQGAYGDAPAALLDSVAAVIAASGSAAEHLYGAVELTRFGFPGQQLRLNTALLHRSGAGPYVATTWFASALAWEARGAWDSALTAWDRYAAVSERPAGVEAFRHAAVGAWLGGLTAEQAEARRGAAVRDLVRDKPAVRAADSAKLAWSDALLAVLRSDQRALARARALLGPGSDTTRFTGRSLAALEALLRGQKRQAAESLAVLDLAGSHDEIDAPHDGYVRSANHLMAARLLLQLGDTTRGERLLVWHEQGDLAPANWVFAAIAYLELARVADAQGRTADARFAYRQFLQRCDRPVAALQPLVTEAQAALRRLS
jgi:hypothetical protein